MRSRSRHDGEEKEEADFMMQELVQQIEETARAAVDGIHTAVPGTIVSFDQARGTAAVRPAGKLSTADGRKLDYPQLTDVPVVFPCCQAAGIAFPVLKGDSCLVVISEVELDGWRSGAEAEGSLRFDLTSAVCIPGLMKSGGGIVSKACQNGAVVVEAGGSEIMVSPSGVSVTAGNARMTVSGSGVAISGDLMVDGNISSTGTITP